MASTSKFTSLPSALRAVSAAAGGSAARPALATRMGARQLVRRPAAATQSRGYADAQTKAQGKASKTGDLPWMLAAGAVTLSGLWFVTSTGGKKKEGQKTHEQHYDEIRKPTESEPQGFGEGGDAKTKHTSSQTGQAVPPPPADNKSTGDENSQDRKEAHDDYKQMTKDKDTKVATSSSEMPSKKTAAEHPKEDPKGGEGEGVQKGGSDP